MYIDTASEQGTGTGGGRRGEERLIVTAEPNKYSNCNLTAHSSHGEGRGGECGGEERRGYPSAQLCCHSSRETLSAKMLSCVRDTFLLNAYE